MAKSNQQQLDELAGQIKADDPTPELRKGSTQLVFGVGNPEAEIVFIGEAPGKKEDEQGEPFVGAAGKLLNEMLALIGLQRKDIYITNIVKYRPPNNRDPYPDEKFAFLPYLKNQLEIIKPKLIVMLGRHSMDSLLPSAPSCASCKAGGPPERCEALTNSEYRKDDVAVATLSAERSLLSGLARSGGESSEYVGRACSTPLKISQVHGKPKRVDGQVYLPLFHPAAALYNGDMKQTLIDDFIKIPLILEKIKEN